MAHIRTVGKIVRAELPYEHLIAERGLVAGPAGRIEDRLIRGGQRTQLAGDQRERIVPTDRLVVIGAGLLHHRLGQPTLLAEPETGPSLEIGDRMVCKERPVDAAYRR